MFINYFNTSYVAVQLSKEHEHVNVHLQFQYILCCGSTLWYSIKGGDFLAFQYILCCGSTFFCNEFGEENVDFNTSYVAVQPLLYTLSRISVSYFNTSYVAVQRGS